MNPYKYWTIALRKKGSGEWQRPDLSKSGIQADPFLIKHEGRNYLFYEKADPVTFKGYLVCMDLDAPEKKARIILKEPFHLSYPHVFEIGGRFYMLPESKQNHKVTLYRAVEFPWSWEKYRDLLEADAVDTTCVQRDGIWYFYTYAEGALRIYTAEVDAEGVPFKLTKLAQDNPSKRRRPGGGFFQKGEDWYRPAQICEHFYGEALVFCKQNREKLPQLSEEEQTEVRASQFKLPGMNPVGIHTYNANEDYEVVDLYCEQRGAAAFFKKLAYIPLQIIYEKVRDSGKHE